MPKSTRFRIVTVAAAVGVAVAVGAASGVITSRQLVASSSSQQAEPRGFPHSFSGIIERVSPAVVSIRVRSAAASRGSAPGSFPMPDGMEIPDALKKFFDQDFFNRFNPRFEQRGRRMPRQRGMGSGFFVDAEGHLVTNRHVVGDAEEAEVVFVDGKTITAQVVGTDARTDLALLKVDSDGAFPFVEFGSSDETKVGDWVVAIGSPFGLGHTATVGIVSARSRDLGAGPYDDFLQIDAPINRGNSGGPTFNLKGEVIGVNTLIVSPSGASAGIGFAIPSDMARDIIGQLKVSGRVARGWLGIGIQTVDEDLATALGLDSPQGALVTAVAKDQPASKSDLRSGDVIVAVDGEAVDSASDLPKIIARFPGNTEIKLAVLRGGDRKSIQVTVGLMPQDVASVFVDTERRHKQTELRLGMRLGELSDQARRRYGIAPDVQGVVVTDVRPGSAAAEKGIRKGDVVTRVAGRDVLKPTDVTELASKALGRTGRPDKPLLVLLKRQSQTLYVALPLGDG